MSKRISEVEYPSDPAWAEEWAEWSGNWIDTQIMKAATLSTTGTKAAPVTYATRLSDPGLWSDELLKIVKSAVTTTKPWPSSLPISSVPTGSAGTKVMPSSISVGIHGKEDGRISKRLSTIWSLYSKRITGKGPHSMLGDEKVYTFEDYVAAVNALKAEGLNEEAIEKAVRKLLIGTPGKKRTRGKFKVRKVRAERDYSVGSEGAIPRGTEHYTWQKNGVTYRSITMPEGGYLPEVLTPLEF